MHSVQVKGTTKWTYNKIKLSEESNYKEYYEYIYNTLLKYILQLNTWKDLNHILFKVNTFSFTK